jgi:hypothetical protein
MRLNNDIDNSQVKKIFEVLREETDIFKGFSQEEINNLLVVFKVLQFKK